MAMSWLQKMSGRLLAQLKLDLNPVVALQPTPFSSVGPRLFVGARPRRENLAVLHQAGVTHVASCLEGERFKEVEFLASEFDHLFLPLLDRLDADLEACFASLFEFAGPEAETKRVLIHCEAGVSRSAALAIALLMQRERCPFYEQYVAVKVRRAEVLPNIGFASQLQSLERQLPASSRPVAEFSSLARYLKLACGVPAELELIQSLLEQHEFDAVAALESMFDGEIPRVVRGARR